MLPNFHVHWMLNQYAPYQQKEMNDYNIIFKLYNYDNKQYPFPEFELCEYYFGNIKSIVNDKTIIIHGKLRYRYFSVNNIIKLSEYSWNEIQNKYNMTFNETQNLISFYFRKKFNITNIVAVKGI